MTATAPEPSEQRIRELYARYKHLTLAAGAAAADARRRFDGTLHVAELSLAAGESSRVETATVAG